MLLDLMVAELLAGVEADQDGPTLLLGMEHDGRPASIGRVYLPQVPASHGGDPTHGYTQSPVSLAVDRFVLGPAQENCYVVRRERGAAEAAVVDPGAGATELRLELARLGTKSAGILVTHTHWDHIGAVADLAEGTGAPVYAPASERVVLESPDEFYAGQGIHIRPHEPEVLLEGGETIDVAGISFEVVSAAGHSPGHIAFYADGCLFSGDVLFAGGVGRTDLPFADWDTLVESIRTLCERFPPDTVVYPGHGPETTLGAELARNPFLAELRASR